MSLLKVKIRSFLTALFVFAAILSLPSTASALTLKCSTDTFATGFKTQILTFPPGGGTNTDAKVSLPIGAIIGPSQVDLAPQTVIGTPYIWIPNSGSGTLAQIRTSNGTLVKLYQNEDGIAGRFPATAFSSTRSTGVSRITVIPGGDVYAANRGNNYITRLKPKPAPSEEYEYGGQLDMGVPWIRAVTFDKKGHVWGATCGNGASDIIKVFCGSATGCGTYDTVLATSTALSGSGKCHYGAIGDKYGFVWTVGNGEVRSYSYNSGAITEEATGSVPSSYGIGIDNNQTIWVGDWVAGATGAHKVNRNTTGNITSIQSCSTPPAPFCSGLAANSGIAADGTTPLGNVWVAGYSTNKVSRFQTDGTFVTNYDVGTTPHGVAIDFDNNAWVVNLDGGSPTGTVLDPSGCGGAGSVTKLKSDGTYIATYATCGNDPYNYSDMTGFRSIPTSMSIGTSEFFPTGATYSGFGNKLQAALVGCSCLDADGNPVCSIDLSDPANCLVPLSLFSVTGGTYTAQKLSIDCTTVVPSTFGGLVPCGRNENDPNTAWDDSAPCNLCFAFQMAKNILDYIFFLTVGLAIFIFVIAGLFYAFSMGNPGRIEKAKQAITLAIIGLAIIFIAWLIVNVVLAALGYTHPFGGSWNIIDCSLP